MADLAGKLNIELRRASAGMDVSIRSSRPVSASGVFVGRGTEETAAGLPALFSICAVAQSCACTSACEAALGLQENAETVHARVMLVDAETVKEHLWRLLLDWPSFLGETPDAPAMARVLAAFNRMRQVLNGNGELFRPGAAGAEPDLAGAEECLDELAAVTVERVLGLPPWQWLGKVENADELVAWSRGTKTLAARLIATLAQAGWSDLGRSQVNPLPHLSAADLDAFLSGEDAGDFLAAPLWRGAPAETSPYTRNRGDSAVTGLTIRFGNGLLPRLAAQLVEVAALQRRLREALCRPSAPAPALAAATGDSVGISQVQAARGLLVHRVELDADRITDYRILAPTEWNFHPQGAVAKGLASLEPADDDTLRRQAGLFVTAVDPCVEYHVAIR